MRPYIKKEFFLEELLKRDSKFLYHANSVETSISYLRYGSVFSREKCVEYKFPQSSQWSDKLDQKYGIWNDIFINFSDLHQNFKKPNSYGPILFCFNINRLFDYLLKNGSNLGITKINPNRWEEQHQDVDKWLSNFEGVFINDKQHKDKKYTFGWSDIVVSCENGSLPLSVVDRIIIDEHPTNVLFYAQTKSIFENCISGHNLDIPIYRRRFCNKECLCKNIHYIENKIEDFKYVLGGWASEYSLTG